jgi:hypothetical protein
MSSGNWFETERKAYDLRTKALTTSSTVTTYTAKVGGSSDGFVVDRVIRVDGTSGSAMTITLPDGKYYGQRCLVILEVYAATSTVDVSTTTGDDATQMTAAGGYSDMVWHGSTLGWVELSNEAT